jgi:hypothetical protein
MPLFAQLCLIPYPFFSFLIIDGPPISGLCLTLGGAPLFKERSRKVTQR